MCLISLWLPPNPWKYLSYNTYRGSPGQQGMAMVRTKGLQGARNAGTSQRKAQGIGGIWALLTAEGLFALLPQDGPCQSCSWGNWAMEGEKGRKWAMPELYRSMVMAGMLWARTRTERWEHQQPTLRVQGRIMATVSQGPLGMTAQEPSKKPAPLVTHLIAVEYVQVFWNISVLNKLLSSAEEGYFPGSPSQASSSLFHSLM